MSPTEVQTGNIHAWLIIIWLLAYVISSHNDFNNFKDIKLKKKNVQLEMAQELKIEN